MVALGVGGHAGAFSLFTAWIYLTLLAPLFNTFTPLPEGELREGIVALAERVGFRTGGIVVMDASRRTAHGNAYFTGLFRQKRIVLFDTLLEAMGACEVLAVLAHELGHFKLHHVRWALVRGLLSTALLFFVLGRCLPLTAFYAAFALDRTSYGALVVFGAWFSLVSFLLQPIASAISRRHEFAADRFAIAHGAAPGPGGGVTEAAGEEPYAPRVTPRLLADLSPHPPLLERLA